jgi:branched-chain amino acid transport system substrate-binding protein
MRVLISAAACLALWWASSAAADDLKIGGIASLSGPAAPFTAPMADAFTLYVKGWNARGGYHGAPVGLEMLDDETNSVNAVTLFRKLANEPAIKVVMTASSSQTAVAIKVIADDFKVPVVGTGTVDQLAVPPAKYFFRTPPGASTFLGALLDWAKGHGYKTMAILNPTDAVGQDESGILHKLAPAAGIKIVAAERYNTSDTDFTAQLVNIRNAHPDFFYAGTIGAPAILVFKQIKQLQLKMPLAIHAAAFGRTFFSGIGGIAEAEGVHTAIERAALSGNPPDAFAPFFNKLAAAQKRRPTEFDEIGWDMGVLVEHAVTTSDGSRDGIRDAIEKTRDLPASGGYFSFSAQDHGGRDKRSVVVAEIRNGEFVAAK